MVTNHCGHLAMLTLPMVKVENKTLLGFWFDLYGLSHFDIPQRP